MDQLIFASLPHHYWYEVGMLKVPAVTYTEVVPENINGSEHVIIYLFITSITQADIKNLVRGHYS